jgi:hypothetical protein
MSSDAHGRDSCAFGSFEMGAAVGLTAEQAQPTCELLDPRQRASARCHTVV